MAQSFWDMLRGRVPEAKGLSISLEPGGFTTEIHSYRRPSYPASDTYALQDAMTRNELVFACLAVKATAALDPRLLVQRAVTKGGKTTYEELPGHPFRQLMMRPNDDMTEADLMKAAIVSWDVSNPRRFYCEKVYTNGLLTALYPLNPACMRAIYSRADRSIIGYEWSDGGYRREYSLDELIIRAAPAWYEPSPTVAAMGAVDSDSSQTDYVRAFFANGGIPSGLLKYKAGKLRKEQREDIREQWRSTYGNASGRQHDVGILDEGVDYQEIGAPLDKLQSQVMRSVAESRICMTFKVPPLIVYAYVGLIRATYSNLKEAWAGFWDATMSPTFKEWRLFWLWQLLPEFEEEQAIRAEQVRLQYDFSQVAAYQEDVDAAHTRARGDFQAGGSTLNEYRAAIGLDADPAGDYYVRLGQAIPAGQMPMNMPAPAMPVPPKGAKARDRGSVQLTERRMEKALAAYLQGEYRRAAEAVREGRHSH